MSELAPWTFDVLAWARSSDPPSDLPNRRLDLSDQERTEAALREARAEAVTIIRDDFGVPHIYAKTDADAVFGMLYAQSEDDFNRRKRHFMDLTKERLKAA